MSSRSRKRARDAKYVMGVDLAAIGSMDTIVIARIDSSIEITIEGEFVPVETRDDHLLDAGGSEP